MSQRRVVLAFISTLTLAGCASPSVDLVPIPATDGAIDLSDGGGARLKLRVQNQGSTSSDSSPVTIEFFLRTLTVTSAVQDGGQLQPGESSKILEFEIPEGCLEAGCAFLVTVDPDKQVKDGNRSNNLARGRCEGETVSKYTPSLGTPRP